MKTIFSFKEKPYGLLMIVAIILLFAIFLPPIAQIDFQDKVMFNAPMDVLVR